MDVPPVSGIADPGPLGLAGFAGTTFFLSVVNTNMLGASVQTIVLGLALFYGGLAQLLAGMWEFAKGNTFGAVAFSSYGAFWLSFWYLLNHLPDKAAPTDILHGVGVYLLVWAIFTAYMTVAAIRVSGAVLAVFVLLTLTFLALAIGWLTESVTDFAKPTATPGSTSAAGSGSSPRWPPGTPRSPRSRTRRSSGSSSRSSLGRDGVASACIVVRSDRGMRFRP